MLARIVIGGIATLACIVSSARAEDAGAKRAIGLFKEVCLANFNHLDQAESWALDRHLLRITNPKALSVFVGRRPRTVSTQPGSEKSYSGGGVFIGGKAWAVPEPEGRYVLALREDPESCVIWAQVANAADVETGYQKIVDAAKKTGLDVTMDTNDSVAVPDGSVHVQVQRMWSGSPETAFSLALATVNRPGGPFQAMIEIQRLLGRDNPINPVIPIDPP